MNGPTQEGWWSLVDTIFGLVVGIGSMIVGSFRWLGKRFAEMEQRMDELEKESNSRNQAGSR